MTIPVLNGHIIHAMPLTQTKKKREEEKNENEKRNRMFLPKKNRKKTLLNSMCMFNGWPSVWLSVHVYACMYDLCVEDHLKYLFQSFSTVSMGFRLFFKNPEPNSLSLRFSHSGLCVSASQNAVALARHCGAIACLVCPCILIVFVRSLVRWFVMPLCFCCSRRRRRCVACMAPATAKPSENSEHTDSLLDYSDQKYKYLLVNNTVEWMFETGRDARRSAVATEKKKT